MTYRYYSSQAVQTQLSAPITNVDLTFTTAAAVGYPTSYPFIISVDYGTANEELMTVTNLTGTTWTVTRAYDGSTAVNHGNGAVVRHVTSARDFKDSRDHEAASTGVHGVTGAVVGTTDSQTLSNKILTTVTVGSSGTDVNQLTVKRGTDTTPAANIAHVTNASGGTDLITVGPRGQTTISPDSNAVIPLTANAASGGSQNIAQFQNGAGNRLVVDPDGALISTNTTTTTVPIQVKAPSGQTGDLTQWKVNNVTLASMGANGVIAPAGINTSGAANLTGGGSLQGTFSGAWTASGGPTFTTAAPSIATSLLTSWGGAWTSFSPTFTVGGSGTNIGSQNGLYLQIGKLVIFQASCTLTGAPGTTGSWQFTVPVAPLNAEPVPVVAKIKANPAGVNYATAGATPSAVGSSTWNITGPTSTTNVTDTSWTQTVPGTWASGNTLRVSGFYIAA